MRAERMGRQKTGQIIGHGVVMAPMMSQDGVHGLVRSMTGHGRLIGHGMIQGMTVLTGVGQVGQRIAPLQAVDSRMLNRVVLKLSNRVLGVSPP